LAKASDGLGRTKDGRNWVREGIEFIDIKRVEGTYSLSHSRETFGTCSHVRTIRLYRQKGEEGPAKGYQNASTTFNQK